MDSVEQLSNALANLIWPVLAVVVIWRLYPTIKRIISSRAFTVKMGGFEFTAQEATEKLLQSTAELQSRVAALDQPPLPAEAVPQGDRQSEAHERRGATSARFPAERHPRHVLWVDDVPDRRAYEVAQLKALGITVDIARSTLAALDLMNSRDFDAVVTSLSRSEEGAYSPTAGLALLEAASDSSYSGSVYIFTANPTPQLIDEVEAAGGHVVMTSMQLFDALWESKGLQETTSEAPTEGSAP